MADIGLLFPGQGSQKIGMAQDFAQNSAQAKELIEAASDRLKIDMQKLMWQENDDLGKTEFTQPAILLNSLIAHKLFSGEISGAKFALGHSLGEISALSAVGAIDIIDAVELVHNRGAIMNDVCKDLGAGMMAVIGLDDKAALQLCETLRKNGAKLWCANYNSDGQIVIAGVKSDLVANEAAFKDAGAKKTVVLDMNIASHCPMLEASCKPFGELLERYIKDSFTCRVISNVSAAAYDTKKDAIELLKKQLTNPVLYKQSISAFDGEVSVYVEFGAGVLKGLNRRATKNETISITDMKSLDAAFKKFG